MSMPRSPWPYPFDYTTSYRIEALLDDETSPSSELLKRPGYRRAFCGGAYFHAASGGIILVYAILRDDPASR